MQKVLVIGYGSIGKRHVNNLNLLGFEPYVLTSYPEERQNVKFIKSLDECVDAYYTIIATPTSQHREDFVKLTEKTSCKKVLIDKPVEASLEKASDIRKIAKKKDILIFVGYNLRFLKIFELIKNTIKKYSQSIRLVKISAGQYLPEWRPYKSYKESYSAYRELGGGVDLDLSHEIDYMLWLFDYPKTKLFSTIDKISELEISSPDYFKGIYRYKNFIVDVELDYIREKERTLRIIGENKVLLDVDFIKKSYKLNKNNVTELKTFDFEESYREELKEFLGINPINKLATLNDGIDVLNLLKNS